MNKGGANGTDTLTGAQNMVDNGTGRSNGDVFYVDAAETITANSANFNYLIELTAGVNLAYGTNFTGISRVRVEYRQQHGQFLQATPILPICTARPATTR